MTIGSGNTLGKPFGPNYRNPYETRKIKKTLK